MGAIHVNAELGVVSIDLAFAKNDKGTAWAKIRAVSKERVRDSNGVYSDGDPTFIDVYINGPKAEHLYESVAPGDQIMVTGKIVNKEWTDDSGAKRDGWRINAWDIGVSMLYTAAPTTRYREQNGTPEPKQAEPVSNLPFDEPPF